MELKINKKIKGTPEEVYRAFTNPFTIELWTDEPAVMQEEAGTEFSWLGGDIAGRNLEFIPNELIRQVWYFEEGESEVTIQLFADKQYTQVRIFQINIPEDAYENIKQGWKESVLEPLSDFFEA
ncbi:MAG: SRPBCC domain-containing protein [Bacteroidales bacterium]